MKNFISSNEKIAHNVVGIESDATHFTVNDKAIEDIAREEAVKKFNTRVDGYIEKFNKHANYLQEFATKFQESMGDFELMAMTNYAIIKPFNENPFQRIKTSGSIITDLGGAKPIYKSNETGEYEEEDSFIHTGVVVKAGPECKQIQEGDVLFWTKPSEVPLPFYKQGLVIVNETRAMAIVRENN